VDVFPLLPPNADPHTYQPGAQDIARVADADLVFSIGLSLEARWFEDLVENAARDHDSIIALAESVDPIDFVEIFDDHGHGHGEHGEEALGRLLIGDGETGMMSVIDLEHGHVEGSFDLGSRAGRIYATKSGRFAIAVSSDANNAHVFDGGIYLEAHGDHFDLVEHEVERLDIDLSGDRPVHLYVGKEWATIFYDGSGDIAFLNEHELEEEGSDYVPPVLNAGPHHGAAVPLEGDLFAISMQHPDYDSAPDDYRLPIGAYVSDLDGNIIHSAEGCEGLHGDAGNGHMAVFGCVGGVLVLEEHGDHFDDYFIGPPAGSPEDFRITSVWGYPGLHHFFGLGSAVGLYIIEPEDGVMEQIIPASEELRPINVAMSHDGEALLVMMSDGELRMYDAHDLDLLASADDFLTEPVETGFWARPHVATAPGAVFITDSLGGEVLQLDDHDLEIVNHWDVEGNPTKIAFVGIYGETEGHEEHGHEEHGHEEDHEEDEHEEEGHEDEHGHEHGHAHGEHDPHFWFDPVRVQQAVNVITAHLSTIDSAGQTAYRENAAAYNKDLDELHHWLEEQVALLPDDHRVLVTSHDAYQYYAQRYGFEVVGTIFPLTTEVEPSAQDLAMLAELIEHEGVPAVFGETTHSDRILRRIAEETGANIIGGLYSGSLGEPGGEAGNYIDMMRFNTITIVEALK
jgi:ABC-type Zn uptake system ZnuABC Zn-binding protein ZnuA